MSCVQDPSESGRLRLPDLYLNRIQTHPPGLRTPLLREMSGQDAASRKGGVPALPVEGGPTSGQE